MLEGIEADDPRTIAAQHRRGRHHLGIEERATAQQPMKEPAVAVGPLHHRRDAEAMRLVLASLYWRARRVVRAGLWAGLYAMPRNFHPRSMLRSFGDKATEALFQDEAVRQFRRIARPTKRKLEPVPVRREGLISRRV
jgi:hypothetical protein